MFTELVLYFTAKSSSTKLPLSIRRPSPRLHFLREWSSSSAVRAVKNPPAFPPFLHVMKTRGEDIRPSISRQSTSHVFRWISAHVLSPASSGGSCCRALSAFLRGHGQWNQHGLSGADKWRLETDRRHLGVWWCDSVRRYFGTLVGCCRTVSFRLSAVRVLCLIGRRGCCGKKPEWKSPNTITLH